MTYRVCIYPAARSPGSPGRTLVLDAETVAEAIVIGTAQVKAVPGGASPPGFEIFGPDDRLVLSFTSAAGPVCLPNDAGLHPDQP
jgi:hypothetical protein